MDVFPPLRILIRMVGIGIAVYGTYLMLACGSRGAIIAVVVCVAFAFLKSRPTARVTLVLAVPLAMLMARAVLPEHTLARLQMFSTEAQDYNDEAGASAALRKKLLLASIHDTLTHPIFGVGPDQFGNFEGSTKTFTNGGWITSHNSYTGISSETGLPGLFFYLSGLVSTFLLLRRTWKQAAQYPETREMATACFCIAVSFIGYCITIFFNNFGYYFYLPGFAGLVIAVSVAVKREVTLLSSAAPVPAAPTFTAFTGRRPAPAWAVNQPRLAPSPNRFRFNGER